MRTNHLIHKVYMFIFSFLILGHINREDIQPAKMICMSVFLLFVTSNEMIPFTRSTLCCNEDYIAWNYCWGFLFLAPRASENWSLVACSSTRCRWRQPIASKRDTLEIGMLTNQRSQFGLVTPLLVALQICFSELTIPCGETDGSFA